MGVTLRRRVFAWVSRAPIGASAVRVTLPAILAVGVIVVLAIMLIAAIRSARHDSEAALASAGRAGQSDLATADMSRAALIQQVQQLAFRLALIEARLRDSPASTLAAGGPAAEGSVPALLALFEVRDRLARGGSFAAPLAVLRRTAPAGVGRDLDALLVHAATGVATQETLRIEFNRLLPVLDDLAAQEDGRIIGRMQRGVTDILAGMGLLDPSLPPPTRRALDTMTDALARGDVAKAVDAATALPADHQTIIASWLTTARARVDVEHSVEALSARAWHAMLPRP